MAFEKLSKDTNPHIQQLRAAVVRGDHKDISYLLEAAASFIEVLIDTIDVKDSNIKMLREHIEQRNDTIERLLKKK